MAQVDLQALNLMPRILNDTLDKNNEIIINTVNGETTVLSPPPLANLIVAGTVVSSSTNTILSARPVPSEPNSNNNNNVTTNNTSNIHHRHIHGGQHTSYNHSNNNINGGSSSGSSTLLINSTSSNERHKKCQYHCSSGRHHRSHHLTNSISNLVTNLSPREAAARYLQAAATAAGTANQQSKCCGHNNNVNNSNTRNSTQDLVDGPPPPTNTSLINDRYLMLDLVEGSTLFKCIDVRANSEHVCKVAVKPCTNLLTAHFRLDGHPHVNQIEKVIDCNEKSYLFFNPSEGDLHSYVRVRKRLRENEARHLFKQMCNVVDACHQEGIILRDLKLRKFVFEDAKSLHLKLETLEDAVVLNDPDNDLLHDRRGCPAYVSPEILRAHTQYSGKAADMWSLGVILYTMLVGRYPFNDTEHTALFAKISRGQYVVPDCLSAKARCIIRALLRRDPEERITSSDVLYHPWLKVDSTRDNCRSLTARDDQMVPVWNPSSSNSCRSD